MVVPALVGLTACPLVDDHRKDAPTSYSTTAKASTVVRSRPPDR
jgi:hypothetical protein